MKHNIIYYSVVISRHDPTVFQESDTDFVCMLTFVRVIGIKIQIFREIMFFHRIKRCFGILFGLSAQVNMAFMFDINTNLNENNKEMS
jgi:hypothetical protein